MSELIEVGVGNVWHVSKIDFVGADCFYSSGINVSCELESKLSPGLKLENSELVKCRNFAACKC